MIIGLTPDNLMAWNGGRDLFRLMGRSLRSALEPDDQLKIVRPADRDSLGWRVARVMARSVTGRATVEWAKTELACGSKSSAARELVGARLPLERASSLMKYGQFDVVGPLGAPPTRKMAAPWVSYIPDLQHRWLPDMFSEQDRLARDQSFATMLKQAGSIIVSGEETKADLNRWFDVGDTPVFSVPLEACPEPEWFDESPDALTSYGVTLPYFICCNQFWKHKNHSLIISAISMAKAQGDELRFVFTGSTEDYRHPQYFAELQHSIAASGIGDIVHILGFVPKMHQIGLMRRATAVVQPTLFEGGAGGLSIHEAIALGKYTVVSNIKPNEEIASYVTEYFDPDSPADLLRALRRVSALPRKEENFAKLMDTGLQRRRSCGAVLRAAFAAAAASRPADPF